MKSLLIAEARMMAKLAAKTRNPVMWDDAMQILRRAII